MPEKKRKICRPQEKEYIFCNVTLYIIYVASLMIPQRNSLNPDLENEKNGRQLFSIRKKPISLLTEGNYCHTLNGKFLTGDKYCH